MAMSIAQIIDALVDATMDDNKANIVKYSAMLAQAETQFNIK
jgi:hypothetical protein